MKSLRKIVALLWFVFNSPNLLAQHQLNLKVTLNPEQKVLMVQETISFVNTSTDSLSYLILNDWNHAYSDKNTPLAKRFSDEFYRGFHLARPAERGATKDLSIVGMDNTSFHWSRIPQNPDIIRVALKKKLGPQQTVQLLLNYESKIPSARFTKFGFYDSKNFHLKDWFLSPARYENHAFVINSNCNLDDIANGISDFELQFTVPKALYLTSDLNVLKKTEQSAQTEYWLQGKNRTDFSLFIKEDSEFQSFKDSEFELISDINDPKLDKIEKDSIINRITAFTTDFIGQYPHKKIIVSQTDYERNPFYGLNQLPSFLNPFTPEFIYEIKFLKTYLNTFLKSSIYFDPRKDNWIYDALQMHAMIMYIEKYHPKTKMMGSISKYKLLKGFNLAQLDFNDQYSYFYMLMARKNLDQTLSSPKTDLIKFNEQIASKYRAGLSLRFLDDYLGQKSVANSIKNFYAQNKEKQVSSQNFENALKSEANKNIDWFFNVIVHSKALIDYKFSNVSKTKDSITFNVKNKNEIPIPIPIYGIKKDSIVFKKWLDLTACDSTMTVARKHADRIVLNYENEVPEFNLRNNWKKLNGFLPNNRPVKWTFMKDLEDPYYNQILYVPIMNYNFYDGLSPGIRLHNKTILEKPFIFDLNPTYSTKTKNLSGSGGISVNQIYRNSHLFNVRYSLSGSYFHYAPDAVYSKISPLVELRFRSPYLRDNTKEALLLRQIIVNKEASTILKEQISENYSVLNLRYYHSKTELINHFSYASELQFSKNFGKWAAEIDYRKLFESNRQINLRFYTGIFLYNTTNGNNFSFALDRPTDYLFDYNYYGRSESTGFFSQQYIQAEGGFKSKLAQPFANSWMSTINGSFNVWNWIEIYGDLGLLKNASYKPRFVYDSGIRLNLVTNYFELFLPVYSTNGWEIQQPQYTTKIRFVVTFSPSTLINLFNRKWF